MEGKKYIDERGWKYKVMGGIGGTEYKARYQKPDKHGEHSGWRGLSSVPWRSTFDRAQTDLDRTAKEKGWQEWQE